jgi:hypothetical protein
MKLAPISYAARFFHGVLVAQLAFSLTARAAEENHFSANTPSGLDEGESFAALNHAFGVKLVKDGDVNEDLPKNGLGFKTANAGVSVRSRVWKGLEVRGYSASRLSEYGLGISYTADVEPVQILVGTEGFTLLEGETFRKSAYTFFAVSSAALAEWRLVPSVGVGYDDFHCLGGIIVGLSLPFSEEHALTGEYHVRLNREKRDADVGKVDSWNIGYRWTSGRHQFALLVANSMAINERQANLGSANNDMNWAFRVTRYF